MVITFNCKDGSETVSLSEIENSDLSSDLLHPLCQKSAIFFRKIADSFCYLLFISNCSCADEKEMLVLFMYLNTLQILKSDSECQISKQTK